MNFLLLVGFSAILLYSAFPALSFWPAAFVALVPLLQALELVKDAKTAFKAGFVWGLFFFTLLLWWLVPTISTYGKIHFLLAIPVVMCLCCYLAIYPGLWAIFTKRLYMSSWSGVQLVIASASCWILLEAIRGWFLSGFPWGAMAYSLAPVPVFIQSADIWSVYGVGFLVLFFNLSIFEVVRMFKKASESGVIPRGFLPLAAIFGLVLGFNSVYGFLKINTPYKTDMQVAAVQAAIDQNKKWAPEVTKFTVDRYINLTREAKERYPGLRLAVWPETAMPFYFQEDSAIKEQVLKFASYSNLYILLGSPSYVFSKGGEINYLNSAYVIGPNGTVLGRYHKTHLVPFGEYMPWGALTSWAKRFLPTAGDFVAGEALESIKAGPFRIGTMICFESIFPQIARKEVAKGANLLAVITNDAWFGQTPAPWQHADMAIFRAVETRRWLVRAANTGVSRIISPLGEVIVSSHLFRPEFVSARVGLCEKKTLYVKYGSMWFVAINLLIVIFSFYKTKEL